MQLFFWLLLILSISRVELFHFFINLTFVQWIIFFGASLGCILFFKRKVKYFVIISARKLKYFSLNKYRSKLSGWAKEANPDEMGKSLASQLKRNAFTYLGCICLYGLAFSSYPIFLTSIIGFTFFMLTLIAYALTSLAFVRKMLIITVVGYFGMAFLPYFMIFVSYVTSINLFETIPPNLTYTLSLDISNLTQVANKWFLFTAPYFILIILFLVLCSVVVRGSLKLVFTIFLKALKSLEPT